MSPHWKLWTNITVTSVCTVVSDILRCYINTDPVGLVCCGLRNVLASGYLVCRDLLPGS